MIRNDHEVNMIRNDHEARMIRNDHEVKMTCKYADDCTQYQIVERGMCSSMQEAVDGLS
jgi:hypothetical protein